MRNLIIIFAASIMVMLVNLDLTIVNLTLATIANDLQIGLTDTQWLIVGYGLAATIFFTLFGRLADRYGRKNIFILGTAIFLIGSLGCGLVNSIYSLVIFRFIQGIGFASTLSLALVIIAACYPAHQKGFGIGVAMTVVGVSQAMGPTIGGIILHYLNWHWVFLINVPLVIISLFLAVVFVPQQAEEELNKRKVCVKNLILFVVSITIIFAAINELNRLPITLFLVFLVFGLLIFRKFVLASFKTEHPLIDVKLLTHKGFLSVISIRFVMMFYMVSILFILPLYMQNILGLKPLIAGLSMLVMGVFIAIFSPIAGKITDRVGYKVLLILSSIIALVSSVFMLFLTAHLSVYLLGAIFLTYGLSLGLHLTPSITAAQKQAPHDGVNAAMGVFFTLALGGSTVGVSLSGVVLNYFSRTDLQSSFQLHQLPYLSQSLWQSLLQVANGAHSYQWYLEQFHQVNNQQIAGLVKQAYIGGLHKTALLLVGVTAGSILFGLMLHNKPGVDKAK